MRYPTRQDAPGPNGRGDLATRLRGVQAAYSDAQHDLDTILTRPTLFDPTDPASAAFRRALEAGERLPTEGGALVVSWAADRVVGELETAWLRARAEADRVGLSRFGPLDRRRVRRARKLLHRACGDRGSIPLREGYFRLAENLLSGRVVLPAALRAEIVQAVRKPSRIAGPIGDGGGAYF